MKKILAISGGIDSVVLLEKLRRDDVVVAHFDHGTRPSSAEDAEFVRRKAEEYGLEFVTAREELGEGVSEEQARKRRYEFLEKVSREYGGAEIYTAHHLDDLVESVAINLLRGTGWRGLAALDRAGVRRPFLEAEPLDKREIREYATERKVTYRQDPTNSDERYLRNRVRERLGNFPEKRQLYELWQRQKKLKAEIEQIVAELLPAEGEAWQRGWFLELDDVVALELLRAGAQRAGVAATRPQLMEFLRAIRTYEAGKKFNLPQGRMVKIGKAEFWW